ncbi:MAG TPA: DUF427 domain-containing protein [Baekduia sp.]|uniref:DUF427 domain-containing protein n=1 Tax=Baekduia sp. TaxID=2600305 RepID=UPI002D78BEC0|nr:DUF427 domain-containing protein [Baekduia sp.]HET6506212.1 DUF427 domain-containing protein [Baekduia sp.]
MSLTHAPGPLAGEPGPANYAIDGPRHRLLATPLPRRVRAELGGETVIDTEGSILVHETGLKPALYVPLADVRADALTRTDHATHCPFKGDASYRTVTVGDRVAENALWVYDEPLAPAAWLDGYAGVYLERFDRRLDEDDEVQGFPDPYHRVDVRRAAGHVEVTAKDGQAIASSDRALVLSETALPNRQYLPSEDVTATLHGPTETTSWCPYKGTATYWTVELADGTRLEDAAWSYEDPYAEATRVKGLVSFWGDAHTAFIRS